MMISKYTIVLCLAAAAAASVIPSMESSHDLIFNYNSLTHKSNPNTRYHIVIGSRIHDDVLQFEELVQGKSGIKVRFNINPNLLINAVVVMDQNSNGNGDYPIVLDGGIGKNYITLQFLGNSGKNIDFLVFIYGR